MIYELCISFALDKNEDFPQVSRLFWFYIPWRLILSHQLFYINSPLSNSSELLALWAGDGWYKTELKARANVSRVVRHTTRINPNAAHYGVCSQLPPDWLRVNAAEKTRWHLWVWDVFCFGAKNVVTSAGSQPRPGAFSFLCAETQTRPLVRVLFSCEHNGRLGSL